MSLRGQACQAKLTSSWGRGLSNSLSVPFNLKVNKAEELNYLYLNIGFN
jgi:hypothetical protein